MSYIGPVTNEVLLHIFNELKKKDNKQKINDHIVDPLLYIFYSKFSSYIYFFLLVQFVIIILLIYLIKISN